MSRLKSFFVALGISVFIGSLVMFTNTRRECFRIVAGGSSAVLAEEPQSSQRTREQAAAKKEDNGSLPNPGFVFDVKTTALVVIDPQNDFLSPQGATWGLVGKCVTENKTVENLSDLFIAAKHVGVPVFISPHYYYPHDHKWNCEGALEKLMHDIHMFDRSGPLNLDGFTDSGADWLQRYKAFINDGETVVVSPHKVYGPQSNDLVLQLRKRGVNKVLLAGMSANLCVESHMRELQEQGFDVAVAWDATGAAQLPGLDGMAAAMVNFRMLASEVMTTQEAVVRIRATGTAR